mgnify:FL=1
MPWVRLDDQFSDHPKIRAVGAIGLALQTAAICYCARYLTDGFLSFSVTDALIQSVLAPITKEDGSIWTLAMTSGMSGDDAETLDWKKMMVSTGLWESRNGGYCVHDYLDYNPSKREYTQMMKSKRISGQAGGQASAQARAQAKSKQDLKRNPSPSPSPSPSEEKDLNTPPQPQITNSKSPHHTIMAEHDRLFTEKFGKRPVIVGARDGAIISALLKSRPLDEVLTLLSGFYKVGTKFVRDRGSYTLPMFKASYNDLLVMQQRGELG